MTITESITQLNTLINGVTRRCVFHLADNPSTNITLPDVRYFIGDVTYSKGKYERYVTTDIPMQCVVETKISSIESLKNARDLVFDIIQAVNNNEISLYARGDNMVNTLYRGGFDSYSFLLIHIDVETMSDTERELKEIILNEESIK